jgi:N-acetylglucosaminyldiphosphoundecaprenol N-acetyl-beta-D-mannosaminyltransferase
MRSIVLMGCQIDNLTLAETLDRVELLIASGTPHEQVSINVDKIVHIQRDSRLREFVNRCALASPDGMPVVWASRLLGMPLKERVAGIDLFEALLARAARNGWRVYLLGAEESVVQAVRADCARRYPALAIAGVRNGYWRPGEEAAVAQAVRDARPDILFVALGSPAKENFLERWQPTMRVPFAMGVGGSFDVVAGRTRRAPRWMQRAGLEWFHRFLQEPRRMFARYFVRDLAFFVLLARELVRYRGRQAIAVLMSLIAAASCFEVFDA